METSIPSGLERKEWLLCHIGHSLLDCVLQVNARSDGELNIAEYVLRLLGINSFNPDHQIPNSSSQQSWMMPYAITAYFTFPPKTMLRMVSTLGSATSNLNISYSWSSLIQLLRSKKLGGFGPLREFTSYGAMSRPVPFTNQVVFPLCFMYLGSFMETAFSIDAFFKFFVHDEYVFLWLS